MIEAYFLQIETIIQAFPDIRFISLTKKIYSTNQGYISGSIIFENDHRLDFVMTMLPTMPKLQLFPIINMKLRVLRQVQRQRLTMCF